MNKPRHRQHVPAPDHRDWKRALQALINANNDRRAKRNGTVSYLTQERRAESLFRSFTLLRDMGYRLAPRNLGGRHIEALMRYWTADPTLGPELAARGVQRKTLTVPKKPYSPAHIQTQLSVLRTFSGWIGKPGLVLPAERYVDDVSLVRRHIVATFDRSWDAHHADFDAILAKINSIDPRVGLQLEVMRAFGLRRKEAVMFRPSRAEVPVHALPLSTAPGPFLMFIRIKHGTKGGRLRFTAVRTQEQERALARARECAPAPGSHIGAPGLTLKQALKRFSNVLNRAGVNRKELGTTPYGLRYQFASDLFVELTDVPPPIRGEEVELSPEVLRAAYLEVARQLGHGRPQIAGAYLGPRRTRRKGRVTPASTQAHRSDSVVRSNSHDC